MVPRRGAKTRSELQASIRHANDPMAYRELRILSDIPYAKATESL